VTDEGADAVGNDPVRVDRRGPIDARLLRYTRSTRRFLNLTVAIGVCTAMLLICQAYLLSSIIAGAFVHHEGIVALRGRFIALLAVVVARSLLAWATEWASNRASATAKSELRLALVDHIAALGPAAVNRDRAGSVAVLATSGIDALDGYFSRYLPQVFVAVIVPVAVIAAIAPFDWLSALILIVTVPLIPLFMALVGASTAQRTARRAAILDRLAGHFVDVVSGLPTLRIFRRAKAQARSIEEFTDRYRTATMSTLRLAFLSSLILELLATVSVALVAVTVGLRLLAGGLDLQTAFFVLILAPEAYMPLRALGASYHASADGMQAADEVFDLLARPLPTRGTRIDVPDVASSRIEIAGLEVVYPGRRLPALRGLTAAIDPGEIVAITGPSGSGKSTLISVLLGLITATRGSVTVGDVDLATLDPDSWRSQVGWVPQHPHLFAGTLAENVRLGAPGASDAAVEAAVAAAGLTSVVASLAEGIDTVLGADGAGLSVGERQRIAIARAFVRDAPLLLLDEPTANLDGATEREVLDAVLRLMVGRTVILVAHRPTLVALADRVIELSPALVAP
jgi:thiol reductant ABC exporter CydD subunit